MHCKSTTYTLVLKRQKWKWSKHKMQRFNFQYVNINHGFAILTHSKQVPIFCIVVYTYCYKPGSEAFFITSHPLKSAVNQQELITKIRESLFGTCRATINTFTKTNKTARLIRVFSKAISIPSVNFYWIKFADKTLLIKIF